MKIICTVINDLNFDQRMQRICNSLSHEGYEVLLVGRRLPYSKPLSDFPFQQKRFKCFFNKGKFFYIEYNIRLLFFLLFTRFDVVCSIDLDTILPGFLVSKWRKKTIVYDAHEYFTEVPEVVNRPKIQKVWESIANYTIPNIQNAYTVCESLAEIFEKKYNTPFQVIRNVPFSQTAENKIDNTILEKFNLKKTAHKKVLLYQGALNEGRGLEEVLHAMVPLVNVELWLAGEGDISQKLRKLVKTYDIESKVHFLGFVRPADLKQLTLHADIGLNLLRLQGLNYYYSLANKCFDYIQAEKPALHPNFPEYQKINAKHEIGILVKDLEVNTLVNAIYSLTDENKRYNTLKANCVKAKQIYTWENEVQKLLAFYKNLK